jgi:hypothetical protein
MMKDRRLACVSFSRAFLQALATEGNETPHSKCIQGLPPGARLIDSYTNAKRGTIVLVLHHPDFEEVPWDTTVPELEVLYETTRQD